MKVKTFNVEKLEILGEIKKKYPTWINEDITSLKFCRTEEMVFLEVFLNSDQVHPVITNLDFVYNEKMNDLLFLPGLDIVDNAKMFLEFGPYELSMCVTGIFTDEAETIVNTSIKT